MTITTLATIIGYSAAALITFGYLPQTIKTIKTRSTDDIAIGTFLSIAIGSICFMVQGILLKNAPLAIANGLATIMSGIIFYIKLVNDARKRKQNRTKSK